MSDHDFLNGVAIMAIIGGIIWAIAWMKYEALQAKLRDNARRNHEMAYLQGPRYRKACDQTEWIGNAYGDGARSYAMDQLYEKWDAEAAAKEDKLYGGGPLTEEEFYELVAEEEARKLVQH